MEKKDPNEKIIETPAEGRDRLGKLKEIGEFVKVADGIFGLAIKGAAGATAVVVIGGLLYGVKVTGEFVNMLKNNLPKIELIGGNTSEVEKVVIGELNLKSEIPFASFTIAETATEKRGVGISLIINGSEIKTPDFHSSSINLTVSKIFVVKAIPKNGDIGKITTTDDGKTLTITIPINSLRVVPQYGTNGEIHNKKTSLTKKVGDGLNPTGASKDDENAKLVVENRLYDSSLEKGEKYYNDIVDKTSNGKNVEAVAYLQDIIEATLRTNGSQKKVLVVVDFRKTKILGYNGSLIFDPANP